MKELFEKSIKDLTRMQSFLLLIFFIAGSFVLDYTKEDKVVKAIKQLVETIEERNLGSVSKSGAVFIYQKTFIAAQRHIRMEISSIIKENSIDKAYRQIEIQDRMNQRLRYFYKMDYAGLSEFKYNGVPLSYGITDVRVDLISDQLTNYMFANIHANPVLMMENIDIILNNIFNEILTDCITNLNKT